MTPSLGRLALILLATVGPVLSALAQAEAPPTPAPIPYDPARDLALAQPPVTVQDYLQMVAAYPEPIWPNAKHGIYGPRHGLSALAMYHFTKDPAYAAQLLAALQDYARAVDEQVGKEGVHYSWEGPYLWGLVARELRQDKLLDKDWEAYLQEFFVGLAEYLSSWTPTINYTRGQHHRAQGEGCARALAIAWYPDIPQAPKWKQYSDAVWGDWWQFRDLGINDTGYFFGALQRVALTAELLGREEVWKDPQMKEFWDRYLYEIAPDGSTVPYGASSGWNSGVGDRIMLMELAAKHTGDGRYRWAAHRMFNYLRARGTPLQLHNHVWATTVEPLCLAALFADEKIKPVEPEGASRVLYRKETTRLTEAEAKVQYPGWGTLDCGMGMTQKVMPHKVILRSGWQPTDLYLMVEAYTRHDPLNPTALIGLVDHGASMAIMSSEKFVSRENEVRVEDPGLAATYMGQAGSQVERKLPTGYAGMECTVEPFEDSPLASYAKLNVSEYMGYRIEQARELAFIKNRFVLVRDRSKFLESFPTRLGPVWNAHTIDKYGPSWLNCYFPYAASLKPAWFDQPRRDLLVYHAPQPARRLEFTPREGDLVVWTAPYSTRYLWEGTPREGETVQFSWLLLPHDPAVSPDALAAGIKFLKDTPELVAVRVNAEADREEWVVLNESGAAVELSDTGAIKRLRTDAKRLYLDWHNDELTRYWASDATYLQVNAAEAFRQEQRGNQTSGKL